MAVAIAINICIIVAITIAITFATVTMGTTTVYLIAFVTDNSVQ